MFATAFDQENVVLGPPKGMTENEVYSLSVYSGPNTADELVCISCWKPTTEELEEIKRTGRVWLTILGERMPPVSVDGFSPFK